MRSKRILIVDDEQGIRESLKEYLELEGFYTQVASCGEEALVLLRDSHFDLIISDIRMPHGDGKFLLRNLKEMDPQSPPLIFMSGFTDLSIEDAYNLGARGIVPKPFQFQELQNKIDELLKKSKEQKLQKDNLIKVTIPAPNLELAISQRRLNCGQNGFFISSEYPMPVVGDQIQIRFDDENLLVEGVVRWIRNYERLGKEKGYGIEFLKISKQLEESIKTFVLQNKVSSTIPISLKS